MKRILIAAIFLCMSCNAAELVAGAKQEIEYLFQHLENSGCQFNRNGTWYSASDASSHLKKKYEYLVKKNLLSTTESFIEKAATESSMSGKPYEVKCAPANSVLSSVWFTRALDEYRKEKPQIK